jgi:hypothetical protein
MSHRDATVCDTSGCRALTFYPQNSMTGAPEGWTHTDGRHACPACTAGTGPVVDDGPCPRCHGICVLRGNPPEHGQCVYCHYWMSPADYNLTDDGGAIAEIPIPELPNSRVLAILLIRNNAEFRAQHALLKPLTDAIAAGGHHGSAGYLVLDAVVTELVRWANKAISASLDTLPIFSYDEVWTQLLGDDADFAGLPAWLIPGSAEEAEADADLCDTCALPDHCLTEGCIVDHLANRCDTEETEDES